MIVRFVTCRVHAGKEADFEAETRKNRNGSIAEPGVLRFDILKDAASPGIYYLYEVYRDLAATEAHKETDHYQLWRNTVADWMAEKRTSIAASPVAPVAESDW